jgi:hypothetical protein
MRGGTRGPTGGVRHGARRGVGWRAAHIHAVCSRFRACEYLRRGGAHQLTDGAPLTRRRRVAVRLQTLGTTAAQAARLRPSRRPPRYAGREAPPAGAQQFAAVAQSGTGGVASSIYAYLCAALSTHDRAAPLRRRLRAVRRWPSRCHWRRRSQRSQQRRRCSSRRRARKRQPTPPPAASLRRHHHASRAAARRPRARMRAGRHHRRRRAARRRRTRGC